MRNSIGMCDVSPKLCLVTEYQRQSKSDYELARNAVEFGLYREAADYQYWGRHYALVARALYEAGES